MMGSLVGTVSNLSISTKQILYRRGLFSYVYGSKSSLGMVRIRTGSIQIVSRDGADDCMDLLLFPPTHQK